MELCWGLVLGGETGGETGEVSTKMCSEAVEKWRESLCKLRRRVLEASTYM